MEGHNNLRAIDRDILRVLCFYEHLTTLQLWYGLGEHDRQKEGVTKEAILSRLEALMARGFVECRRDAEGGIRWALRRGGHFDAAFLLG